MGIMATNDLKFDPLGWSLGKYGYGGSAGGSAGGAAALGAAALGAYGNTYKPGAGAVTGAGKDQGAIPGTSVNLNESPIVSKPSDIVVENGLSGTGSGTVKPPTTNTPNLEDKTDENLQYSFSNQDYVDFLTQLRDEQWAREDEIRAETQAREDNAYSRAIEDLRNSGVNVNLLGSISPAGSGGGITNATGMDTGMLEKQIDAETNLLIKTIEQNWKGEQNDLDRVIQSITSVLQIAGQLGAGYLIGKGKGK